VAVDEADPDAAALAGGGAEGLDGRAPGPAAPKEELKKSKNKNK